MKYILVLLSCVLLSCQQSARKIAVTSVVNTTMDIKNDSAIHHIEEKYDLGDIDYNGIKDTATVSFDFDFDTNEVVCEKKVCAININFGAGIPDLDIAHTLGVFVKPAPDVNNDQADDILVFSRTNEGYWNDVTAFSFSKGQWIELATIKCFYSEDSDAENRIVKVKKNYFLVGDEWNDAKGGVVKRSIRKPLKTNQP